MLLLVVVRAPRWRRTRTTRTSLTTRARCGSSSNKVTRSAAGVEIIGYSDTNFIGTMRTSVLSCSAKTLSLILMGAIRRKGPYEDACGEEGQDEDVHRKEQLIGAALIHIKLLLPLLLLLLGGGGLPIGR